MESEKVKEIKEALECCKTQSQNDCRNCPYGENPKCLDLLMGNSLTYINELESENERLKTSEFNSCQELDNASNQIHSLEDRIAELEKENAKLLDSVETVQSNRCTTKCELTKNQLKQFAEKLKVQIKAKVDYYNDEVFDYSYNGISEKEIDETLKEFLK